MRPKRRVLLCLLLVLSSSGCRHIAPSPLAPERVAEGLEKRSLTDPGLRQFLAERLGQEPEPWPMPRWKLDDLTLAALYFQPDLRVARAAAGVARAQVGAAGQRPNPTLVAQPQWVANLDSGVAPWLAFFQVDWTIETAGKRGHRMDAASARASAAEIAIETAIWSTRSSVNGAVIALEAAAARRELWARSLEAQIRLVALLDERLRAGAVAESAVAPQRMALLQAEADLAASSRQVLEARATLAAVIGVPRAALEGVEIDFPLDVTPGRLPDLSSAGARRAALLGRADVRALLAEYDAAESDLRLELAKQYPNLHIGPSYEFDQGSNKWGLAVALDLPLLSQNQGAIDEALARRAWVAARFEALQARVIAEVDYAAESFEGALAELDRAGGLVEGARRRLGMQERSLEMGAADRVAVWTARLEVQRASVLLTDSQERSLDAVARLEHAVQPRRSFMEPGTSGPSRPPDAGGDR
jgi:outer membrane protein TolC